MRILRLIGISVLLATTSLAHATNDPLESPMWDYLRNIFLGDQPYQFDAQVQVQVPPFAEDPTQVPITIDASALAGQIDRIVVWADLNPIQHVYTYHPIKGVAPRVSLRIKVQQGTPVRAAVLTHAGVWHVGGSYLNAAGGGCTTPSVGNASPYWESHLGEIEARRFQRDGAERYKFRIIHPMDTGLVDSIPEFYLQQLELRNASGDALVRMDLSQPVSENPVFTFDITEPGEHHLWLRDNNGNEFERSLQGEI